MSNTILNLRGGGGGVCAWSGTGGCKISFDGVASHESVSKFAADIRIGC